MKETSFNSIPHLIKRYRFNYINFRTVLIIIDTTSSSLYTYTIHSNTDSDRTTTLTIYPFTKYKYEKRDANKRFMHYFILDSQDKQNNTAHNHPRTRRRCVGTDTRRHSLRAWRRGCHMPSIAPSNAPDALRAVSQIVLTRDTDKPMLRAAAGGRGGGRASHLTCNCCRVSPVTDASTSNNDQPPLS